MNKYKSVKQIENQIKARYTEIGGEVLERFKKVKKEDLNYYIGIIASEFTKSLDNERDLIRIYKEKEGYRVNWSACGTQDLETTLKFARDLEAAVNFAEQLEIEFKV